MSSLSSWSVVGRAGLVICAATWWLLILWKLVDAPSDKPWLLYTHLSLGVLVMYYVVQRDFYLWFLAKTVFPCEALTTKEPENAEVTVHLEGLPANVNVVYWGAEADATTDVAENPWLAYKKFANAGVARTNPDGSVDMSLRTPVPYKVPTGRVLPRHLHYRFCEEGVLSSVKTIEF